MAPSHYPTRQTLFRASLADELRLPEYRLRKLIHEEMGFRNFNVFLHHYRLREACGMLSDRRQARTPILTIALTVGYQSINTFNRAFRQTLGETPSAFRARSVGGRED
ncbi:MAG: helix-turn-helix transcriptional regulator [Gammaproteobacteria bacterium]|nr:helix-turn-helix transcriptional regulator [Gammaproteobacteria bacterium]